MHKPWKQLPIRIVTIGAALVAAGLASAEESAWDGDLRAAVRLVAGAALRDSAGPAVRAGIEIRLAPGWKTYWRYPGDSGVPPRFDFSGSRNVAAIAVQWPAPHRFTDDGGTSIGYKNHVIFPLRVTPRDARMPVALRLKLDYAVCEKLCVPVEAQSSLAVSGAPTAHDAAIVAAEARVPKPASGTGPLSIAAVRRVAGGAKPLVTVDVIAPAGTEVELFAEGRTAEWALPVPVPVPGAPPGHRYFGFELDGLPPGVDPNGPLEVRLTAVAGGEAIEATSRLD